MFFFQKIGSPTSASAAELVESLVSQSLASPTTKPESSSSPLSYEASSSPAPVADPVLEHAKVRRMKTHLGDGTLWGKSLGGKILVQQLFTLPYIYFVLFHPLPIFYLSSSICHSTKAKLKKKTHTRRKQHYESP